MRALLHAVPVAYRLWRHWRLSRPGRALASARERRLTPRRLAAHAARVGTSDPSHAAEWPHLRHVLESLRLLTAGFVVDLAAGDGVTSSCTLPLFRDLGWSGLAIECDLARFTLLRHALAGFAGVRCVQRKVTPSNATDLLHQYSVPRDFALLNLDLDSFDLEVAEALLEDYRPAVVDMEINEKVPPPIRFAVRYKPDHEWNEGHCYGCSLAAAADVLGRRGYRLEGVEYNNAFFLRGDLAERAGIQGAGVGEAFRTGYADRADRLRVFPWNREMDALLRLPVAEALERLHNRFRREGADFLLQAEPLSVDWARYPPSPASRPILRQRP